MLLLFGGVTPSQAIAASGIPSEEDFVGNEFGGPIGGEAFGGGATPDGVVVTADAPNPVQTVTPSGIASGGASAGLLLLFSGDTVGTPVVGRRIVPPIIEIPFVVGSGTILSASTPAIIPAGIGSAESFGTAKINYEVEPSSIASAEAFGTLKVNYEVEPSGITSAEAYGTAKINLGITPSSIASAESFGTHVVAPELDTTSIASAEAFGAAKINFEVEPASIASGEAFGTTQFSVVATVSLSGIASAESFGTAQINLTISPSGIASAESFGTHAVAPELDTASIPSAEAFGSVKINLTIQSIAGIGSAEAFGTAQINLTIAPSGINTGETFGTTVIKLTVTPSSIASGESVGAPDLVYVITPDGVASGEAVGEAQLIPGAVTVLPSGIPTEELVSADIALFNDVVWIEVNQDVNVIEWIQLIGVVSPTQTITAEDTSSQTNADETLRIKEFVL